MEKGWNLFLQFQGTLAHFTQTITCEIHSVTFFNISNGFFKMFLFFGNFIHCVLIMFIPYPNSSDPPLPLQSSTCTLCVYAFVTAVRFCGQLPFYTQKTVSFMFFSLLVQQIPYLGEVECDIYVPFRFDHSKVLLFAY